MFFGFSLFVISAVFYIVAVWFLLVPAEPTIIQLTLGQIGNIFGIGGMLIIPIFIVCTFILMWRGNKLRKQETTDDDDHTEFGTAGGS